jgi:hypothetical protein
MRFTISRTKKLWLAAVFLVLISVFVLPRFILGEGTIHATEEARAEREYANEPLKSLPLYVQEEIRVAKCLKLSSQFRWGEGNPSFSLEVAESFLLGYPCGGKIVYNAKLINRDQFRATRWIR